MPLLISLLYLLLNIAVILLVVAIVWWVLGLLGIALDARVMKIGQVIVALIILIYVVSWLAGAIPPRGIFGRVGSTVPGEFAFHLARQTFV
jgi:uncharacterized membrane protein YtjA (UPF0391 family)